MNCGRRRHSYSLLLLLLRRSAAEEVEQLAVAVEEFEVQDVFEEEVEKHLVVALEEENVPSQ